ncbi:TadE/TadG family type IV pilus assembly protein [Benzoatithermus flavus]|uniref:TadE/TadG family type IV pilus assembly protein n=1 Tax=Benzoatithermus flavus TaxID=3108223 RepID=A0ABU8XNP8_9PROT
MTAAAPAPPRRLLADRSAVSSIEFAITAPLVLIVILLLIETGFLLTGGILLEAGVRAAARVGITGSTSGGLTREALIRQTITRYVCPSILPGATGGVCLWTTSGVPLQDGSPLILTPKVYGDPRNIGVSEPYVDNAPANGRYDPGEIFTDLNGNRQWDADLGVAGLGGPGDLVVYTADMPQRVINPLLQAALGGAIYHHTATLVIRNEPS